MIFSEQKIFAYKFEYTLPNATGQKSVALPNVIDLGASDKPFRVKRALKRNIGGGDPIPLMATINTMDSDVKAVFSFVLETSPDNSTWRTIFEGVNFTGLGYRLNVDNVPSGTERYLRMVFKNEYESSSDVRINKKVTLTAAIGTHQTSKLKKL